jgi:hypothetical protein
VVYFVAQPDSRLIEKIAISIEIFFMVDILDPLLVA